MQAIVDGPAHSLFFEQALLPDGWADHVRVTIAAGRIAALEAGAAAQSGDERHGCALPPMPNLHSHAFQRAMAGSAERSGSTADSFWTWREAMYASVGRMGPGELQAVAALAYMEMLETGFGRVGEFHYLHHDRDGSHFGNIAEMSGAIIAAAEDSGIGLTLLPVLYSFAGFGALPPQQAQRRFILDTDGYMRLREEARTLARGLPDAIVGAAPHSLRAIAPAQLEALASARVDGPIHIHIAEQAREVEDCQRWSGQRPVEWLLGHADVDERWCLVHATHMTDEETTGLARTGAVAGLCPITEANLGDGLFPASLFLQAGGAIGIGSDSNVRIDCSEELRLLEYGQRLQSRSRNALAGGPDRSTGSRLYQAAVRGGGQALGAPPALVAGEPADIVSLDLAHPSMIGKSGDGLIDAYLFSAGTSAVDCVWRHGHKLVTGGRHVRRDQIVRRYAAALERISA